MVAVLIRFGDGGDKHGRWEVKDSERSGSGLNSADERQVGGVYSRGLVIYGDKNSQKLHSQGLQVASGAASRGCRYNPRLQC